MLSTPGNWKMIKEQKHPLEAKDSWNEYLKRQGKHHHHHHHHHHHNHHNDDHDNDDDEQEQDQDDQRRMLHHNNHHEDDGDMLRLEHEREKEYWKEKEKRDERAAQKDMKKAKKHRKHLHDLYKDPGIADDTVHGLMIDAGSTGSRMHLFEWNPRILHSASDVEDAVSGRKLSFPGTESRWTDRLKPGISSFADLVDENDLQAALVEYLSPLMDFAINVLSTKSQSFGTFPIYLRATAGMRTLDKNDRARVMKGVRMLFANTTFSPFHFEEEQARVISGEEEAIFGWAGVNFLLGTLIEDSEGAGTVINPRLTVGALDLGGASTQISFYQSDQDIMSNLFKFQIGQGKHWNLYAHSFLYYGINEATSRMEAWLMDGLDAKERLVNGVHNPCLPGGATKDVRSNIHILDGRIETWAFEQNSSGTGNGFQNAIIQNKKATGDYEECSKIVHKLLHSDKNDWCNFAHRGDCSFAGIYQPELPPQSKRAGEFLAFSNYHHIWQFLGLPSRASIAQLENATQTVCQFSEKELLDYVGNDEFDDGVLNDMCFRSTYALQLLKDGYGFKVDDYITATDVVGGQKVGWALGAMMYEINTLPWKYNMNNGVGGDIKQMVDNRLESKMLPETIFFVVLFLGLLVALVTIFRAKRYYNSRKHYESIGEECKLLIAEKC